MSQGIKRPLSPSDSAMDEDQHMYSSGPQSLEEIDEKYPSRPRNHSQTMPFFELIKSLFNPLTKPTPSGPAAKARGAAKKISPTEQRRNIIERFLSRWRNEVGDDIYPAMRLILPEIDRERGTYRLKEQAIGKLLIKVMGILPKSEDGMSLVNWKVPGKTQASRMAGDFAGRCFEALKKRPIRNDPGDMRVGEVNELLDKLAAASGEAEQRPIFEEFYKRMNPEELQWLIRIMLKQMKIGATEKTFLNLWHVDGAQLFNVSSSLRHVCWELWDYHVRLEKAKTELSLMSSFQPQLAHFPLQTATFDKMVQKLGLEDGDSEYWIEEKLDGERMQLHLQKDETVPGGYRFGFWSRKAKDYTFLYGDSFEDDRSALTQYLRPAFRKGIRDIILDGEMIAWDPTMGKMLAFGTLKTAALTAQKNPFNTEGWRPLFRVFDMVYCGGRDFRDYELKARREALRKLVFDVPGRLEIHEYTSARSPGDIEPMLRKVIENSGEGLVLKNPRSPYVLADRPNTWIKVKPEYMAEFGENLDCVIIAGYYGSGKRGGFLASFLCGLRARRQDINAGIEGPEKFYSFFKVGGGLRAEDYAQIQHLTDGKWHDWNPKSASQYVELAGGDRYFERPDMWIRPSDSVVVEVKAASVEKSTSFRVGQTLRFPRFRRIRTDKTWENGALDMDDWQELQANVEQQVQERKEMEMEDRRNKRPTKRQKRQLTIAGDVDFVAVVKDKLFEGKTFYVPGGSQNPKKSKGELEKLIKEHGGTIIQNPARVRKDSDVTALADKNGGHALSLKTKEGVNIITPKWMLDCIKQEYVLPYEDKHLFHATDDMQAMAAENTDEFGDSYCRDVDVDGLRDIFANMKRRKADIEGFDKDAFYDQLEANGHELPRSRGYVFRKCRVYFAPVEAILELTMARLRSYVGFGNGEVVEGLDEDVTHVVVVGGGDEDAAREIASDVRARLSRQEKLRIPRVVTEKWIDDCWKEETLVSEEDYTPS